MLSWFKACKAKVPLQKVTEAQMYAIMGDVSKRIKYDYYPSYEHMARKDAEIEPLKAFADQQEPHIRNEYYRWIKFYMGENDKERKRHLMWYDSDKRTKEIEAARNSGGKITFSE